MFVCDTQRVNIHNHHQLRNTHPPLPTLLLLGCTSPSEFPAEGSESSGCPRGPLSRRAGALTISWPSPVEPNRTSPVYPSPWARQHISCYLCVQHDNRARGKQRLCLRPREPFGTRQSCLFFCTQKHLGEMWPYQFCWEQLGTENPLTYSLPSWQSVVAYQYNPSHHSLPEWRGHCPAFSIDIKKNKLKITLSWKEQLFSRMQDFIVN